MLSIIVPVYNQIEITRECIQALLNHTSVPSEIIIIDNGSEPDLTLPFTGFIDTKIIRNDLNTGFPAAVNQGVKEAKGDVIILLNNDVIVTPGWDEKLISTLNDGYDIVGPVTNYCAGLQKVKIDDYENTSELEQAAFDWEQEQKGHIQEVNFVIGFCMAFKSELIKSIGLFDESMWPCSGEEVDFCLRAIESGYRVAINYECYVHHEGSITFKEMHANGQLDYHDICRTVDKKLMDKWGEDYWDRQEVSSNIVPHGTCLNLGCGYRKLEGFTNIDYRKEVNPDLVCDVINGLPFDDNSVDLIRADDFLEHIPIFQTKDVIEEIYRVLKPGGIFESITPDAEYGQGAFQDPTHISFWVENSWLYYSDKASRELYGTKANFEIKSIERIETGRRVFHLHVIARKLCE